MAGAAAADEAELKGFGTEDVRSNFSAVLCVGSADAGAVLAEPEVVGPKPKTGAGVAVEEADTTGSGAGFVEDVAEEKLNGVGVLADADVDEPVVDGNAGNGVEDAVTAVADVDEGAPKENAGAGDAATGAGDAATSAGAVSADEAEDDEAPDDDVAGAKGATEPIGSDAGGRLNPKAGTLNGSSFFSSFSAAAGFMEENTLNGASDFLASNANTGVGTSAVDAGASVDLVPAMDGNAGTSEEDFVSSCAAG
jgi:hypothetical protein